MDASPVNLGLLTTKPRAAEEFGSKLAKWFNRRSAVRSERVAEPPLSVDPAVSTDRILRAEKPPERLADANIEVGFAAEMPPAQAEDFYSTVAQLLLREIEANPTRMDLRRQLLEIYYVSRSSDAFVAQTQDYLELLRGQADKHWPEIARKGREMLPFSSLFVENPPIPVTRIKEIDDQSNRGQRFERFYESAYINHSKLSGRLEEVAAAWKKFSGTSDFKKALSHNLAAFLQRPTALMPLDGLSKALGGARLFGKLEGDDTHDEPQFINAIGQCLLASSMGKTRVVAAASEPLHGPAVAAAAKQLGLQCTIYITAVERDRLPRMTKEIADFGAEVIVTDPSPFTSSDIRVRALEDWIDHPDSTMFVNGLDAGPGAYSRITMSLMGVIGQEVRAQLFESTRALPHSVVVGTNNHMKALGMLQSFLAGKTIQLYCVEAAPTGAAIQSHGYRREHAWLQSTKRVSYTRISDSDAEAAADAARLYLGWELGRESARVLSQACKVARTLPLTQIVVVMLPVHAPSV
jgi:tryptophan synthase beta chain